MIQLLFIVLQALCTLGAVITFCKELRSTSRTACLLMAGGTCGLLAIAFADNPIHPLNIFSICANCLTIICGIFILTIATD